MSRLTGNGTNQFEATITEDGNDNAVDLGPDALTAGEYWIDVAQYQFASLYVDVDATGSSVTVEGKATANAPVEDISAKAPEAVDARVLDSFDLTGWAYMRIKSDGADTETTSFYLLLEA